MSKCLLSLQISVWDPSLFIKAIQNPGFPPLGRLSTRLLRLNRVYINGDILNWTQCQDWFSQDLSYQNTSTNYFYSRYLRYKQKICQEIIFFSCGRRLFTGADDIFLHSRLSTQIPFDNIGILGQPPGQAQTVHSQN